MNTYEDIKKQINEARQYYDALMFQAENSIYMRPSLYLLARNISFVYDMLNNCDNNIEKWYKVLDQRNISYVAWNLSNSKGSASIIKNGYDAMTDFSDDALKEWGVWYKAWVRKKFGLDE